jgi:hypothetical protein
MPAMRMVQVPFDQVVDMAAVRHSLMPALGAVDVAGFVIRATVVEGAALRVGRRHLDCVLVNMIAVQVMQVPVVEIVDMVAMSHADVAAFGPVLVGVAGMMREGAGRHGSSFLSTHGFISTGISRLNGLPASGRLAFPSNHGQFGSFCACCGGDHRLDGALSCRRSSFPLGLGVMGRLAGSRASGRV